MKFSEISTEHSERARLSADFSAYFKEKEKTPKKVSEPVFEDFKRYTHIVVDDKGRIKEVPLRCGKGSSGFIDQITFTFSEETLNELGGGKILVSNDDYVVALSFELEKIFGFGVTQKNEHKGRLFYHETYSIGDSDLKFGTVHIGGQNGTIAVEITAKGANSAKDGWEHRLYEFLNQSVRGKITRIDIAHDFLNGEYTPEQAFSDWENGGFSWTNRKPKIECAGTDWFSCDNSGKTLYVGSRQSSKYVRVYEKGKQLKDKSSSWVRFEIEFKAHDQIIDFDILLKPGMYLSGAYPLCEKLFENTCPARFEVHKKTTEISFEHCIKYAKQQAGRVINLLMGLDFSAIDVINKLKNDFDLIPKRLDARIISFSAQVQTPLHKLSDPFPSIEKEMMDLNDDYLLPLTIMKG